MSDVFYFFLCYCSILSHNRYCNGNNLFNSIYLLSIYLSVNFRIDIQDYISDLTTAILKNNEEDFILECVGILANLTISDLDYELLLREYDLIPWIHNKLKPGALCLPYACRMLAVCLSYACRMLAVCLPYACRMLVVCLPYSCSVCD